MKEFEKLLLEDTRRRENEKALNEVKLGLFEQKKEETFDYSNYTLITYGKKYKGLYDLYQNNDTFELVYVCPLVENNKDEDGKDEKIMAPYAYDVLYIEFLNQEEYDLVLKASTHEKGLLLDVLYKAAIIGYFAILLITFVSLIIVIITNSGSAFTSALLLCGPLVGSLLIATILLPLLIIKYRKFKAQ